MKRHFTSILAFSGVSAELEGVYNSAAMILPIPRRELQRAFTEFVKQSDVPSAVPSSESLKIRCAIADYILNSREGSLEERLLEFVATVPLDM